MVDTRITANQNRLYKIKMYLKVIHVHVPIVREQYHIFQRFRN